LGVQIGGIADIEAGHVERLDREEESMMDEDRAAHPMTFVSGFILGAMVGAGIALLAAPEAGMRTRRRIRRVSGELRESAGDHWDDLAEDVKDKVDDAVRGARKRFVVRRD
jgi:hypothetical protein